MVRYVWYIWSTSNPNVPILFDREKFQHSPVGSLGLVYWVSSFYDRNLLDRKDIHIIHDDVANVSREIIWRNVDQVQESSLGPWRLKD